MYRVGICDDDKILCSLLEEQIQRLSADMSVKFEIGAFIRDEMEDTDTHIVYISAKQGYAMELFKMQPLEFPVKPISAASSFRQA